jgi:hypothetical protein
MVPAARPMIRASMVMLLGLCPVVAAAADKADKFEWKQTQEKDGIKVYRKSIEGSKIVAFRGVAVVDAPVGKVLHVIADNDHRTEWVDRLYISQTLELVSPSEFVVYAGYKLPSLFSNRDYVYRGKAFTKKDGSVYVQIKSEEHPKAPPTIGVRAWLNNCVYLLVPVEGGKKTMVDVEVHTDPKGSMPTWLVNLVQKSWPYKTLSAIRKQVQKPFVQDMALPPPAPPEIEAAPIAAQ